MGLLVLLDHPPWEAEWSRTRAFQVDRAAGLSFRESLTLWSDGGSRRVTHEIGEDQDDFERVIRQIEHQIRMHNERLGPAGHGIDLGHVHRKPGLLESRTGLVLAVAGSAVSALALIGVAIGGLPRRGNAIDWPVTYYASMFVLACSVFAVQVSRVRARRHAAGSGRNRRMTAPGT